MSELTSSSTSVKGDASVTVTARLDRVAPSADLNVLVRSDDAELFDDPSAGAVSDRGYASPSSYGIGRKTVGRATDSLEPYIDSWVICDTGSTDGREHKISSSLGDIPGHLIERPWVNFRAR